MKQYKIVIISGNSIVFSDIIKAHGLGNAIVKVAYILDSYDHCKVECNLIKDGK